jgi:hypothetical protein
MKKKPKLKKGEKVAYRNDENILLLAWRNKRVVSMISIWSTSASEPVRRKIKGNQGEQVIMQKPSVAVNYMNMKGADSADQYTTSYCFLWKTVKWWLKLLFWGMEVSIINTYTLYKEVYKKNKKQPTTHIKFRQHLARELVGDFHQGRGATRRG